MSLDSSIVKDLFFEAVRDAHQFIIESYKRIATKYKIPESKKGEHPFICWSESDLRTLIVHYLMLKLKGKAFIHTEMVLKRADKFKYDGKYQRELWVKAVERILNYRGRKYTAGDIDIALTPAETDTIPFLLIAETKYYHYSVERYGRDVVKEVEEAYNILRMLKEVGLTREIAMVIGDHYYHRQKPEKARKLEEFTQKHSKDIVYLKI